MHFEALFFLVWEWVWLPPAPPKVWKISHLFFFNPYLTHNNRFLLSDRRFKPLFYSINSSFVFLLKENSLHKNKSYLQPCQVLLLKPSSPSPPPTLWTFTGLVISIVCCKSRIDKCVAQSNAKINYVYESKSSFAVSFPNK